MTEGKKLYVTFDKNRKFHGIYSNKKILFDKIVEEMGTTNLKILVFYKYPSLDEFWVRKCSYQSLSGWLADYDRFIIVEDDYEENRMTLHKGYLNE